MMHYPLYPDRPTLSLDGVWEFAWLGDVPDIRSVELTDCDFSERMAVPGVFDTGPRNAGRRGVGVYRKRFHFAPPAGHRLRLRIGGLGLCACVMFNGELVGEMRLPYSSAVFDLPGQGERHELIVAVDNRFDQGHTPLFRPDYDFFGYGGIYRSVGIEAVPACFIERVEVRTLSLDQGQVRLRIVLGGDIPPAIEGGIGFDEGPDETFHETPVQGVVELQRTVPDHVVWSLEQPALHTVSVAIGSDRIVERFGIRTIEAKSRQILLNGKPVFLCGVNRHESHPEFGPVQPTHLMTDDVAWLKDLGCNFVRCVHYPQDPAFLDLCDETGLLVWQESLGWNNTQAEVSDPDFQALQIEQTSRMVKEGINHPAIIFWAFLNEGCSDTQAGRVLYGTLAETVRAADDSRLVSFASNRHEQDLCFEFADVMAMTMYPGWIGNRRDWYGKAQDEIAPYVDAMAHHADQPALREKPFLVAEIGVCGLYGCHDRACAQWSEEFQANYMVEACRAIARNERFCGLALWQMFDTRSFVDVGAVRGKPRGFNCAGLLDEYRRPKLAYDAVKQSFSEIEGSP